MTSPKQGKTLEGNALHYSVGALIKKDGRYLLIDRVNQPLGYAVLAGHVDEGESPEEAVRREVKEESNLNVSACKQIAEGVFDDVSCVLGVKTHHWYLFDCEVNGEIKKENDEAKSIGWYTPEKIRLLDLEPSWSRWFKKLGII